jgi:enoyl-CoA hydratase/carnithine racemase
MDDVIEERDGHVSVLRWNRPSRRNAITSVMYSRMAELLTAAEADAGVRAVLITGTPEGFSAGNDLEDFAKFPPTGPDAPVLVFLRALSTFSKPLIAAVSGPAVGIGTTMLLHCDLVFAAENTRFAMPFTQLGLCPEAASSLLLPRLMGYQRAAELLLLGDPFSADDAYRMGLVNRVVDSGAVEAEAMRYARRLASLSGTALKVTKSLLKGDPADTVATRIAQEAERFETLLKGPAALEALLAFSQKRKPDFSSID